MRTMLTSGFLVLLLGIFNAHAVEERYEVLEPAIPTSNPKKVELIDVFMYTCPHCYAFKKVIEPWAHSKDFPDYIDYQPMPAVYNPKQVAAAKAFYTAQALNIFDKFHSEAFALIHDKNQRPRSEQDWIDLVSNVSGMKKSEVKKIYNSFAIDNKTRKANELTIKYGITATPTVILNGKYRFSATSTGSHQNTVELAKQLAAQEWQAMEAKQPKEAMPEKVTKPVVAPKVKPTVDKSADKSPEAVKPE